MNGFYLFYTSLFFEILKMILIINITDGAYNMELSLNNLLKHYIDDIKEIVVYFMF